MQRPIVVAAASIAFVLSVATPIGAMATAQRTFVASYGNDANPCSIALPCRSFAAAVLQTAGGEVIVLDSAGYGPVTITQAVSIIAPAGVYAGISVPTLGTGIVVRSVGIVRLSGLTITGRVPGNFPASMGIDLQVGSTVHIERTTVSGFFNSALNIRLDQSTPVQITIDASAFIYNTGNGIFATSGLDSVTIEINNSRFDGNAVGMNIGDNIRGVISGSSFNYNTTGFRAQNSAGALNNVTLRDCVISRNSFFGIDTGGDIGETNATMVQVTDCEISDNVEFGIIPGRGSVVTVSNTTLTRNGSAAVSLSSGGIANTFSDNRVYANGVDGTFTATITKQ